MQTKDKRYPMSVPRVYRMSFPCGKVYAAQTKRVVDTRLNEHKANGSLGHSEKSSITDNASNKIITKSDFKTDKF